MNKQTMKSHRLGDASGITHVVALNSGAAIEDVPGEITIHKIDKFTNKQHTLIISLDELRVLAEAYL